MKQQTAVMEPSLLLFVLAVGFAVLAIHSLRSRSRLWIVVCAIACLLVVRYRLLTFHEHDSVAHNGDTSVVVQADEELLKIIRSSEDRETPVAWKPEVDEIYLADRYPTRRQAAEASGRHVKTLIHEILSEGIDSEIALNKNSSIIVYFAEPRVDESNLLTEVAKSIESVIPETNVVQKYNSLPDPIDSDSEFHVVVRPSVLLRDESRRESLHGGEITLTVACNSAAPKSATLQYDSNSTWAIDDVSRDSLRIRTPEFSSERLASDKELQFQIAQQLMSLSTKLRISWPDRNIDLTEEISRRIDPVVGKRFTQELTNDRGDRFYRSAAALNLHESVVMLHELATDLYPVRKEEAVASSFPIRGLAGLLAAVFGVSLMLKTIMRTKGHAHASR